MPSIPPVNQQEWFRAGTDGVLLHAGHVSHINQQEQNAITLFPPHFLRFLPFAYLPSILLSETYSSDQSHKTSEAVRTFQMRIMRTVVRFSPDSKAGKEPSS
ncbi:hypothetical protein HNY73_001101 [Argiope bruennichi]|uniref:Uncharacterized protein n=1 Tax=Argiope bruennichi TaxID=94029 RepID=A0A8T0G3Y4_ARGBR|nr:hypothetical protein HNY73_001101 [Argiope bruennichi]